MRFAKITINAILFASIAAQVYYFSFLYSDVSYREEASTRNNMLNIRDTTVYVSDFDYYAFTISKYAFVGLLGATLIYALWKRRLWNRRESKPI